eukprot:TRINITY_DN2077_c1_g2_i1.p1 TRINITY_DN2077_c1_g2~~TRINITY_DN2077_c1_g2_i1.p1  ORF type:complete len:461 (+),score=90.01 TRINITY_DN2077_c1_g2_i1:106-1383(+)
MPGKQQRPGSRPGGDSKKDGLFDVSRFRFSCPGFAEREPSGGNVTTLGGLQLPRWDVLCAGMYLEYDQLEAELRAKYHTGETTGEAPAARPRGDAARAAAAKQQQLLQTDDRFPALRSPPAGRQTSSFLPTHRSPRKPPDVSTPLAQPTPVALPPRVSKQEAAAGVSPPSPKKEVHAHAHAAALSKQTRQAAEGPPPQMPERPKVGSAAAAPRRPERKHVPSAVPQKPPSRPVAPTVVPQKPPPRPVASSAPTSALDEIGTRLYYEGADARREKMRALAEEHAPVRHTAKLSQQQAAASAQRLSERRTDSSELPPVPLSVGKGTLTSAQQEALTGRLHHDDAYETRRQKLEDKYEERWAALSAPQIKLAKGEAKRSLDRLYQKPKPPPPKPAAAAPQRRVVRRPKKVVGEVGEAGESADAEVPQA